MLRTFVNGKIHQLKVTGLEPAYYTWSDKT
jgi:hypothetical protein